MIDVLMVFVAIIVAFFVGSMEGTATTKQEYQAACVAKYADMPHNKVEDFCKTLLKFESAK